MKILGTAGFAQYNIPNRKIKLAYGTNQPDLRQYLVHETSPLKKKKKAYDFRIRRNSMVSNQATNL